MSRRQMLHLDIETILKSRIPKSRQRFIPKSFYKVLASLIHQDDLNEILRITFPSVGSEFAHKLLNHLGISIMLEGEKNFPLPGKRVVFACNHPLGGLDGIALIDVLGNYYGDENVRFIVNDLLMNIEPLEKMFIPINKYGGQARECVEIINQEYASGRNIVVFPAGLVSRLHDDGKVRDLTWQKSFVTKALAHDRDIVPLRFVALNRKRFYRVARWRKKLNIKVNLEQAILPAELCAAKGKTFKVIIGKPIDIGSLKKLGVSFVDAADHIRTLVYDLYQPEKI